MVRQDDYSGREQKCRAVAAAVMQTKDDGGLDRVVRSEQILDIFCMVLCPSRSNANFSVCYPRSFMICLPNPSGAPGALHKFLCVPGARRHCLPDATTSGLRYFPSFSKSGSTIFSGSYAYLHPSVSLSLIHISEPTRHICLSRMPSSA